MYLHIGKDFSVRDSSVVGIFDLDNTTLSQKSRAFLNEAEKNGEIVPCDELPKSFVLTTQYGFSRVYLSPLTTATLEKRMK